LARDVAVELTPDFFQTTSKVLTVAELTRAIRGTLETKFGAVWVQGEISNYKLHPSGHQYFTLKDQRAAISCVIFRNTLPPGAPPIADGAQVQVYGNVSVFEARGQYQLSVQILQTRGAGLLQAKFEALKRKLEAEGLFDPARKRPLPKFPKRIGIITSPSGAAIRDMLNVLRRRAPNVSVLISPVRVQGIGAAAEIATAINEMAVPNEAWQPIDLIVITRGGGSIEDLWEFNEEIVARAIFHSAIPVVSAVGHEIDFTIADFVADLRAPTPSAAAELIVSDSVELGRRVSELANCLQKCLRSFLVQSQTRLRFLSERTLARELVQRMRDAQQQLDLTAESLRRRLKQFVIDARTTLSARTQSLKSHDPKRELILRRANLLELGRRIVAQPPRFLQNAQQRFQRVESVLRVLGPDATLRRGYSITTDAAGKVIQTVAAVRPKSKIRTRVADGEFESEIIPTVEQSNLRHPSRRTKTTSDS
jgi:exodeoxyribonuclease VII large subunit